MLKESSTNRVSGVLEGRLQVSSRPGSTVLHGPSGRTTVVLSVAPSIEQKNQMCELLLSASGRFFYHVAVVAAFAWKICHDLALAWEEHCAIDASMSLTLDSSCAVSFRCT